MNNNSLILLLILVTCASSTLTFYSDSACTTEVTQFPTASGVCFTYRINASNGILLINSFTVASNQASFYGSDSCTGEIVAVDSSEDCVSLVTNFVDFGVTATYVKAS